ncbi:class I SAM-dependent methyltransferase [bacterium]|nr:class I SAM-dependent methyltransferase [bacterium]
MARDSTTSPPTWRSSVDWAAYDKAWAGLNRPFLTQALERMPLLARADIWLHIPGVGSGLELEDLRNHYPGSSFVTSDLTPTTSATIHDILATLDQPPRFLLEDAQQPAVNNIDLSFNVFMLHLVDDPCATIQALWQTLTPGGWLACLYFPPVPTGQGPLASLFWAVSDVLAGRVKPNWEQDALPWLMGKASRLTSRLLYAKWSFSALQEFRAALEVLPHIQALRVKLGDARYEQVWSLWSETPGLFPDKSEGWHGTAAARFLLAQKPTKRVW